MSRFIVQAFNNGTYDRPLGFEVTDLPDECPICHRGIDPIWRYGWHEGEAINLMYQCPRADCRILFISRFSLNDYRSRATRTSVYNYKGSAPWQPKERDFPPEIKAISPKFCVMYNEAAEAEHRELKGICGAGYRRALEFLIKDYLINEKARDKDEVVGKFLGNCISEQIDDKRIKDCAKRAAWLGNDQTHYYRQWADQDLEELKVLIDLTVNWIHNEALTEKFRSEMPENKK